MVTILVNTCAIRYYFINKKFAKKVCQVFKIKPQCLIIIKQIHKFYDRVAKPIIHAIYPTLTFGTHIKSLILLPITKLGNHPMILGQSWMKKHGVIIDMRNNFLAFWPGYYSFFFHHIKPTYIDYENNSC